MRNRTKVQDLCYRDQYDRDMDAEPTGQLDLDLRKLRYFVAVAEELHFGRAAERLYLAQPVLSRQIQKLEQELGVTLFERTSRNVALTSAGRQLVDEARPLLAAGDAARRRVRQAAEARPTLTVGFFTGDTTVTRSIRLFRDRRPDVTTQVRRIYWSDQAQVLLDGAADVAFVHLPIDERGLELVPLYAEERVALLAADHPLARKKSLSITQLADDPVVLHRGASDAWEAFHNQNPRPDGHVAPARADGQQPRGEARGDRVGRGDQLRPAVGRRRRAPSAGRGDRAGAPTSRPRRSAWPRTARGSRRSMPASATPRAKLRRPKRRRACRMPGPGRRSSSSTGDLVARGRTSAWRARGAPQSLCMTSICGPSGSARYLSPHWRSEVSTG